MKPVFFVVALACCAAAQPVTVAVERDGSLLTRKDLTLDQAAGVLRWKKKEYPLSGFYLVESENGALLWTPDYGARVRGYEFLARAEIFKRSRKLFKKAIRYKAQKLARTLFEIAQDHGLGGRDVEKARKNLLRLETRPGRRSPKADAIAEQTKALAQIHPDLFFVRTKLELKVSRANGLRMLRDTLRMAPNHAGALAKLTSFAPKNFALGNARVWLDWHLDVEVLGAKLATRDSFNMRQALKHWRKDLNAIESGVVLVITPVTDSRILGRTLGCCRMTTDLLAELFGVYPVRRKKVDPLRIFLFENREEYVRESGGNRPAKDNAFLEWSAGHYSPGEGISRLYWVTNRNAESRIIGTAVHELTHHWLADANPAYNRAEGSRSARCPGFWIIEGFAEFMEEGNYNLDQGTWSLFDRRADSLDTIVALTGSSRTRSSPLIDWKTLYGGTSLTFWALDKKMDISVRRRWKLGADIVSKTQLWYVQSAATCQYLYHAEDGKYRRALLDYVVHHYTGKAKLMPIQKAFGMSPEALGKRVEEFARKVRAGWRPKVTPARAARAGSSAQEGANQKEGNAGK